jgi:small subunit ribosomal protein S27Ae
MQIFVTLLEQTKCFTVAPGSTIEELIQQVRNEFGSDLDLEIFTSTQKLESSDILSLDSELMNLQALVSVEGGKKKKKKKVFTTPKTKKHIHKNVKLRALSYFTINKDGSVSTVKKLCESKECAGKGIFMANHKNRVYCGNCHITMIKKDEPKAKGK